MLSASPQPLEQGIPDQLSHEVDASELSQELESLEIGGQFLTGHHGESA
jgi:hypothetical protein